MKDTIVLHHSADASIGNQFHKVFDYHNRGAPESTGRLKWSPNKGIQYHVFIEKSGMVVWHQNLDAILYHAGEWNERAIGVCLAGSFNHEIPNERQLASLVSVIDELKTKHPIGFIYNHREVRKTSCPSLDLRLAYETTKRRMMEGHVDGVAKIRALRRAIDRSVGDTKEGLKRQLERLRFRLEASVFDPTECC